MLTPLFLKRNFHPAMEEDTLTYKYNPSRMYIFWGGCHRVGLLYIGMLNIISRFFIAVYMRSAD